MKYWLLSWNENMSIQRPLSLSRSFAQKNINPLFPYCPELPKQTKQKNSSSKMWLIDKVYIELEFSSLNLAKGE